MAGTRLLELTGVSMAFGGLNVIDELDVHVAADGGGTAEGGFRADEPGRYTYYCSVPGHRDAGMEGTLVVR